MALHVCRQFGAVVLISALSTAAVAADYAAVVEQITVARPAEVVWNKIGKFCDIAVWMKRKCDYISGTGDLGTVRRLDDKIDEVMVGQTAMSYTYAPPASTVLYHGTLAVEADGPTRARIIYSVIYDQEPQSTPDAKAAERKKRSDRWAGVLKDMKALAESD